MYMFFSLFPFKYRLLNILIPIIDDFAPSLPSGFHQFQVSTQHYSTYYDTSENIGKLELIHPAVTGGEVKELLMEFPPSFERGTRFNSFGR
jgi:hypothetical protein